MAKAPLRIAFLVFILTCAHPAQADLLSISLRGTGWQGDERAGYNAMLQVELGWEQLLFGRRDARHFAGPDDAGPPPGSERPPDPPPQEPLPDAPSNEDEDRQTVPEAGSLRATSTEPLPAWFRSDFARSLLRVVLRVPARSGAALDSLSARSRTSTLLPVLRLRAGRGADETLRYSPTLDDPDRWLQSGGAEFRYEAQATWTLDRLIFTDDEIAVERLRQQAARAERDRGVRALRVFFEWQSAAYRLERTDLDEDARIKLQVLKIQSEIELDVLSGGWFSRELARLQFQTPAN